MNIELQALLDLLTYNNLFEYVTLPSTICADILLEDPEHNICFVESLNISTCCVWYPTHNWVKEFKRRQDLDEASLKFRKEYILNPENKKFQHSTVKVLNTQQIIQKLMEAQRDNNMELVNKYGAMLAAL